MSGGNFPVLRAASGTPRPDRYRWLAVADSEIEITRIDDKTLKVHPKGGFFGDPSHSVSRDPKSIIGQKPTFEVPGMKVEVLTLGDDGLPREVLAHFEEPLESATYAWFQWTDAGYRTFPLPAIGETRLLPKAAPPLTM